MSVTITEYDTSAVIKLRPGSLTIIILTADRRYDFEHQVRSDKHLNALAMFNLGQPGLEVAYLGNDRSTGDLAWQNAAIGHSLAADIAVVETDDEP